MRTLSIKTIHTTRRYSNQHSNEIKRTFTVLVVGVCVARSVVCECIEGAMHRQEILRMEWNDVCTYVAPRSNVPSMESPTHNVQSKKRTSH